MNDYRQHESSEAIRADIEQTRADMGAKIDRIQDKLDPSKLREQAQETVQEFLTDSSNAMVDYVRTNREQISDSVVHAVKRNPIPTALVAMGLGWLVVESLASQSDRPSYDYRRRYEYDYERNRSLPVPREENVRYGSAYDSAARGTYSGAHYSEQARDRYGTEYRGADFRGTPRWDESYGGHTPTYGEAQGSSAVGAQGYQENRTGVYRGEGGRWESGEEQSRMEEAKDRVQGAAQKAGEKASEAMDTVRHAASSAADCMRGQAEHMGERTRGQTEHMGERMRGQAEHMGERMRGQAEDMGERMSDMGHMARDRSREMGQQARRMGRQAGRQLEHTIEENPMMMGAIAFAVGAAVAMLLPPTRTERRIMGPARDQVMESAQELAEDATHRAQRIAEEVGPELEQTARKVVEDVKQTGKEAAQDLQQTAQKTQERAKEEAKAEAEEAKNKAKETTQQMRQSTGGQGTSTTTGTSVTSGTAATTGTSTTAGATSGTTTGTPENWDTIKGKWNQWKGEAKRQWGKLTDDELTRMEGDYDILVGKLQEKYGYSRSQAEQEVRTFSRSNLSKRS